MKFGSAASLARSFGFRKLTEVSEMTGISRKTLTNWAVSRPELFRVVLLGCLYIRSESPSTDAPATTPSVDV